MASTSRVISLDQLRGFSMLTMLIANLGYGGCNDDGCYTFQGILAPFFTHGITFLSGPDLIEPAFHFCVGFALRLTIQRRLRDSGGRWLPVFIELLRFRVAGLIILTAFVTQGWGSFDTFPSSFSVWWLQTVQNAQIYHTLTHIAFVTVWTFPAMAAPGLWPRLVQLVGTACLLVVFHATFYWEWIKTYSLDEGGYFGFLGWAIEALVGSFVFDLTQWAAKSDAARIAATGSGTENAAGRAPAAGAAPVQLSTPTKTERTPLLKSAGSSVADAGPSSASSHVAADISPPSSWMATAGAWLSRLAAGRLLACTGARYSPARGAALLISVAFSVALMLLGWLLGFLGSVAPLTVCYDSGDRIFFFGGYGDVVPCPGRGFIPPAPFQIPDPRTQPLSMWGLSQRGGTVSYHIFTAGTSLLAFAVLYLASELGTPVRAPAVWAEAVWWRPWRLAESAFGLRLLPLPAAAAFAPPPPGSPAKSVRSPPPSGALELADMPAGFAHLPGAGQRSLSMSAGALPAGLAHFPINLAVTDASPAAPPPEQRLLVGRWDLLELLGENSLAVYLMSDVMSDKLGDMMPFDIPLWYFVLCELGFIALITACTLYLKMHKLFLRL